MNKNVVLVMVAVGCVATALALGPQWLGSSPINQPTPVAVQDAAPTVDKCICGDRSADGHGCICRDISKCAPGCSGAAANAAKSNGCPCGCGGQC